MLISLLGYMTSGKTSVGQHLSKKCKVEFYDLDQVIEEKENSSINDIFKNKGEIYFRKLEHKTLKELLQLNKGVISLGGGTPCYYNNIELINERSVSFYLNTTIKELVNRISIFKANRPLVKNLSKDNLQEYVAKHLFDRNPYYHQANHIINTQSLTFDQIANTILTILEKESK